MKLEPHGIYVQFDEKLEANFRKLLGIIIIYLLKLVYDMLLSPTSFCTIALSDMFNVSTSSHLYGVVRSHEGITWFNT